MCPTKTVRFHTSILVLVVTSSMFSSMCSSTPCSIFPSLNCSCFQFNTNSNSSSLIRTHAHMYCQGSSLSEETFQTPFGSDFQHQYHLRTISMEFFIEDRVEIQSNQFDALALLFSDTDVEDRTDVIIRLIGFTHVTFHNYSLTSTMFRRRPENKRLWLHLIPMRSNSTEIELDEDNSTHIENQFQFHSNCFSGLTVSQLSVYIHTKRDDFPAAHSFEKIFNQTNIGELHLHGTIFRPCSSSFSEAFHGRIRSLRLYRRVDIIDASTFPFYSHVYSYTIHSTEAYSMNLSSFLPFYTNLRGLEIVKPRFKVSIDQLIPTLDSLTIDVEDLDEETLFAARHIYNLKLGSSLRSIDPKIFVFLSRRLRHLDLSELNLSQMKSESRCHLIKFIYNNNRRDLNIVFPQLENLTECDCSRLFINYLQLTATFDKLLNFPTCSKQCHLSDCETLREYFKQADPLDIDEDSLYHILNETTDSDSRLTNNLPSVDVISNSDDDQMIEYLINQTNEDERDITSRTPTTTVTRFIDMPFIDEVATLKDIQEYDEIIPLSTPKLFESWEDDIDQPSSDLVKSNIRQPFSWISFFIGVGVVLLLMTICLIVYLFLQRQQNNHFTSLSACV